MCICAIEKAIERSYRFQSFAGGDEYKEQTREKEREGEMRERDITKGLNKYINLRKKLESVFCFRCDL